MNPTSRSRRSAHSSTSQVSGILDAFDAAGFEPPDVYQSGDRLIFEALKRGQATASARTDADPDSNGPTQVNFTDQHGAGGERASEPDDPSGSFFVGGGRIFVDELIAASGPGLLSTLHRQPNRRMRAERKCLGRPGIGPRITRRYQTPSTASQFVGSAPDEYSHPPRPATRGIRPGWRLQRSGGHVHGPQPTLPRPCRLAPWSR